VQSHNEKELVANLKGKLEKLNLIHSIQLELRHLV